MTKAKSKGFAHSKQLRILDDGKKVPQLFDLPRPAEITAKTFCCEGKIDGVPAMVSYSLREYRIHAKNEGDLGRVYNSALDRLLNPDSVSQYQR